MNHRRTLQWVYWITTIVWLLFCFAGTEVGLAYRFQEPVAPIVLDGIVIAVTPPVLVYLIFRLFAKP